MKNLNKILIFLALTASFTSCSDDTCIPGKGLKDVTVTKEAVNPTEITHKFVKAAGEYVVSNGPVIVSADEVYENLADYLVIDTRSADEYTQGHINGALNVKLENLVEYMDTKVAANAYKKIIMTCHSGQSASFAAGILRTIGYNNVYSMKYGMNAWSNKYPNKWAANVSSKLSKNLETKNNPKGKAGKLPEIKSEKQLASAILKERAISVLKKGWKDATIRVDEVTSNPDKYYVISYWPIERYNAGHLKGSVQYTPKKDLRMDASLNTLPTNKTIVVYCYTGQVSAYTVAYLRTLGYDAKTMVFGANSFENSVLIDKGWAGFTSSAVANDYPSITGPNPTNAKASVGIAKAKPTKKKKAVKRKKKAVSGGCG